MKILFRTKDDRRITIIERGGTCRMIQAAGNWQRVTDHPQLTDALRMAFYPQ